MKDNSSHTEHISRRVGRWAAPLFVVCAILLALATFYLEENWRGNVVWKRTKKDLEAKGEILDWNHYLPTPPPDERNMMKVPGIAETFIKGNTGGLNISTTPSRMFNSTNSLRFGEIELVREADHPTTSVRMLQTNAMTRRDLMRQFVGRVADTPTGLYLTAREPGAEVKRVLVLDDAPFEIKTFQDKERALKPTVDKIELLGTNVYALMLQPGRCYTAEEYIVWSASQSNLFGMIDEAAKRPECWLPGDYSVPFAAPIASFVAVRSAAQLFASRAQAFLLLNRPDEAYAELQRIHTLKRIVSAKPVVLVAAMIHVAITGLEISVISDGFSMGAWREKHWRGFIDSYAESRLLPQVVESLRSGERSGVLQLIGDLSSGGKAAEKDVGEPIARFMRVAPRGWAQLNAAFYARAVQEQIELLDGKIWLDPERTQRMNEEMINRLEQRATPTRTIARMAVVNISKASQTAVKNQIFLDQLMIAAALELHRAERGEYPKTLADLSPKHLEQIPRDVILGKPLRYEKRRNGEYALYSIGWNAVDDIAPLLAYPETPMLEIFESKLAQEDWIWTGVPESSVK
jgi:hypothetical protein